MNLWAVVCFLLFVFVTKSDGQCSHTNPCMFKGGELLRQPQQHISSNGELSLTYNVRMADFQVEWLTLHRRTYNGEIPGATWRIKRGDKVNLHLNNTLTEPEKLQPFNGFRFTNSTNIHTHGLHISSREPEDNIFVHLKPGQSYNYKYNIDPDNPSGTYWYHSHLHGASLFQVHSGMAGMIIVDDVKHETPDHLWKVSCPEHCEHDIQLVFQPILEYRNLFGNGFSTLQMRMQDNQLFWHTNIISSGGTLAQWLARNIYLYTVNGQVKPVVAMPTGQTKRFR
nr:uncharacterized protein LOC100175928 isoform X1 [Ciona intestinalis]|eukprot:XP_018672869.2 uncharacterized protein LOC100175928 isoform X1 [Ciona intestinalis]